MDILLVGLVLELFGVLSPIQKEYVQRVDGHYNEMVSDYQVSQGWRLDIPSLGMSEQMDEVSIEGKTIPVPEDKPGVLVGENGLFIVGHTPGVFSRLAEMPDEVIVRQNGASSSYRLYSYEESRVEDIKMSRVLGFNGVAIMTCSGEMVGGKMSHRLILYYK